MRLLVVGLFVAFGALACGTSDTSGSCVPGSTQQCFCAGAVTGAQACNNDGTGWLPCECAGGQADAGKVDGSGEQDIAAAQDAGPVDTGVATDAGCKPVNDKFEAKCDGKDFVYWYDDCGKISVLKEKCNPPKTTCSEGACITGCTYNAYKACHEGKVWWFDSCDNPQSPFKICASTEFCLNKNCSKGVYDGTYNVTADPPNKSLGGLGNAKFIPVDMAFSVSGTTAKLSFSHPLDGIVHSFVGTLKDKKFNGAVKYTVKGQLGPQEFDEKIDVTFEADPKKTSQAAPHLFKGNIYSSIKASGLPLGNVIWDVTGIKK